LGEIECSGIIRDVDATTMRDAIVDAAVGLNLLSFLNPPPKKATSKTLLMLAGLILCHWVMDKEEV
jgi:hypothetical protein